MVATYNSEMAVRASSPADAGQVLRTEDRDAWRGYVVLEQEGVRNEAFRALLDLAERLKTYSPEEQRRFVEALLDGVGQRGNGPFTIRYPLWNEYVFPVLLERWDRREPDAARALLSFGNQIHGGNECRELIGDRDLSERALLERALQHEPDAADLKTQWLSVHEYHFDFAIHEVPYGVLWGEGATLSDYQGALQTLDRFAVYAADIGLTERYADHLSEWRYYFEAYCGYLESCERYASFEVYLDAHPMRE